MRVALALAGPRVDEWTGVLQAGCGTQTVWIERPSERARSRAARMEIKKAHKRNKLDDRHLTLRGLSISLRIPARRAKLLRTLRAASEPAGACVRHAGVAEPRLDL